jgi:hypothetical protein
LLEAIVVVDYIQQCREAAIVIETTFLVRPKDLSKAKCDNVHPVNALPENHQFQSPQPYAYSSQVR